MRKTITFKLRMSELDYNIIKRKSELLDISIAELLRQSAINKQVKGFRMSDIQKPEQQVKGQMEISNFL